MTISSHKSWISHNYSGFFNMKTENKKNMEKKVHFCKNENKKNVTDF